MDKPFLTFDEQIDKLKNNYHLVIEDYSFAKEALSSFSYYDLVNGYQSIYMLDNIYKEGISIELLCATHIFNKNIQGVLLKYCTYAENTFKTLLSHVIAGSFSEHQDKYLDIRNYEYDRNLDRRKKLRKVIAKMKDTCVDYHENPTKHYIENKNHVPPWILFRNISFSDTTDLFTFLKRNEKEIFFSHIDFLNPDILGYPNKVNVITDALNLVRKFRNKIAHNLDFITYRGSSLNRKANLLFEDTLIYSDEINNTKSDVWSMVISINILLNNKYLVQNFLGELNSFMKFDHAIASIYCETTGIPIDFEDRIVKFREKSIVLS